MIQQKLFGGGPTFASVHYDVKAAMHDAARESQLSREQLLDRMNEIATRQNVVLVSGNGKGLTMDTLEKWLNPNETQRYPSPAALTVFCAAAESVGPLAVMAGLLGAQIIDEKDSRLLAWAKAYHKAKGLRKEMAKLEEQI